MDSIQGKFKRLRTIFIVLAVLITIQFLLLYLLHLNTSSKLASANSNANSFLELIKDQNDVYQGLAESLEAKSSQNLVALNEKILELRNSLKAWGNEGIKEGLLTEALVADELRRLTNFQNALVKIRGGEYADADIILRLEKKVFFSKPLIVSSIIEAVIKDGKTAEFYIQSCFLLSILLNIPVFIVLVMTSKQLFGSVDKDLLSLVGVANSITDGTNETIKSVDCKLEDTKTLFEAFSDMEVALRNRKMLSDTVVEEAQSSNKELEVKVEKGNNEIHKANELLSRKNEELEQILYAASHDLRTPLIGIQGFSQELQYISEMLVEELKATDIEIESNEKLNDILTQEIPNSVDFILKGSNKMDSMIQGLLRISRVGLEEFKFSEVDMDELLKQIVDGLSFQAQSANAMIIVEELQPCMADKEKIEHVFTNLITNAIKYRQPDKPCEIKITCEQDGENMRYSVTDNGLGISEENLKSIYKTFYRVSNEVSTGEGLGLTIANRIVDRHDGTLDVSSTVGEGSNFTVVLPRNQEKTSLGDTENE